MTFAINASAANTLGSIATDLEKTLGDMVDNISDAKKAAKLLSQVSDLGSQQSNLAQALKKKQLSDAVGQSL